MGIWIPGWSRHEFNLRGKPYQYTHNPKGLVHTTEGSSIAGALAAYAPYPPHGIYDWRTREKLQHISLDLASYSAMDGSDDDYMVQIEFVGKAAETRNWPDEAWRNIAEDVFKPLEDLFGIPRVEIWHGFKDGGDGIYPYISTAESPIRISPTQLRDFSGWLGHQHLPAPDNHWDPGRFQIQKVFHFMSTTNVLPVEEEDSMTKILRGNEQGDIYLVTAFPDGNIEKLYIGDPNVVPVYEAALGTTTKTVDQWKLNYIPVGDGRQTQQPVDLQALIDALVPPLVAAVREADQGGLNEAETIEAVKKALRQGSGTGA